jgi:hypothetical protein
MPKKDKVLFYTLKEKWTRRHKNLQKEIFTKHKDSFDWFIENSKQLAVSSLAGIFLLTSPIVPKIQTTFSSDNATISQAIDKKIFLIYDLKSVLPKTVQPLTSQQEQEVSRILTRAYGIKVSPSLEGKRLNTTYGLIGQEQHLQRYPGDNIYEHFDSEDEAQKYFDYGMAPGLGGFGYFAYSKESMTQEQNDREKYYIAVQTFLAPNYEKNVKDYIDFFKFRKMLVVNPQNGKAVVADIGDSGPALWTGKQLGGSPEVMRYLERSDGAQIGPVLYFFIDDPNNTIPLGPISYN